MRGIHSALIEKAMPKVSHRLSWDGCFVDAWPCRGVSLLRGDSALAEVCIGTYIALEALGAGAGLSFA